MNAGATPSLWGASVILAGCGLVVTAGLIVWHWNAWKRTSVRTELPGAEREYLWRQFRRRMQTSSMLSLALVALVVGQLIPARKVPTLFSAYWLGVVLLLGWVVLLACGDAAASWAHLRRTAADRQVARDQLQAEVARLKQAASEEAERAASELRNGHARHR